MSMATGATVYLAAFMVCDWRDLFWPTMLGFVAERIPQSGALGLSVMGGIGMFAVSMWNPVIGTWIDEARKTAAKVTSDPQQLELAAGQATLENLALFPLVLILAFGILRWYTTKQDINISRIEAGANNEA